MVGGVEVVIVGGRLVVVNGSEFDVVGGMVVVVVGNIVMVPLPGLAGTPVSLSQDTIPVKRNSKETMNTIEYLMVHPFSTFFHAVVVFSLVWASFSQSQILHGRRVIPGQNIF